MDFGNSKAGSSGFMTVDGGNSSAAVSILTSSAHHKAPKHSEARVGLLTCIESFLQMLSSVQ